MFAYRAKISVVLQYDWHTDPFGDDVTQRDVVPGRQI
jgi:hypothetical protein